MTGVRPMVNAGYLTDALVNPGDTILTGDTVQSISGTVGITIPAASLLTGYLTRTGATTAGFTDTLDTASNIIAALSAGNNNNIPVVEPGTSFKLRIINTTGYTETIAAGTGITLSSGGGNVFTLATNTWRELLFTVNSVQPVTALQSVTTSASTSVTFVLANGQFAIPIGPNPQADNIMPGASVSGTGIAAGTTVAGLVMGQGGLLGITLSGTATATGTAALTFSSALTVTDVGAGTY